MKVYRIADDGGATREVSRKDAKTRSKVGSGYLTAHPHFVVPCFAGNQEIRIRMPLTEHTESTEASSHIATPLWPLCLCERKNLSVRRAKTPPSPSQIRKIAKPLNSAELRSSIFELRS